MADEEDITKEYGSGRLPMALVRGPDWRSEIGGGKNCLVFDDNRKRIYIEALYKTGKPSIASRYAEVHTATVSRHLQMDSEFKVACEEALALRAQNIVNQIEERALNGFKQQAGVDRENNPIYRQVYETSLASKMLDRYDPAYKQESGGGGFASAALIVPGGLTHEEWKALFTPAEQEGVVIEGKAVEVPTQPSSTQQVEDAEIVEATKPEPVAVPQQPNRFKDIL